MFTHVPDKPHPKRLCCQTEAEWNIRSKIMLKSVTFVFVGSVQYSNIPLSSYFSKVHSNFWVKQVKGLDYLKSGEKTVNQFLIWSYRMSWENIWVGFENHFKQVGIQLKEGNSLSQQSRKLWQENWFFSSLNSAEKKAENQNASKQEGRTKLTEEYNKNKICMTCLICFLYCGWKLSFPTYNLQQNVEGL